jgi:hypothetical protein
MSLAERPVSRSSSQWAERVQRSTILLSAGLPSPGPFTEMSGPLLRTHTVQGDSHASARGHVERERELQGAGGRSTPAGRGTTARDHRRRVVLRERLGRAVGAVTVAAVSRGARQYIARPAVVFVQSPEAEGL